jgi:hypothetical protein
MLLEVNDIQLYKLQNKAPAIIPGFLDPLTPKQSTNKLQNKLPL